MCDNQMDQEHVQAVNDLVTSTVFVTPHFNHD